ncbi:hypothetical protein VTI28DRAFT_9549 [Corynascus sepedonium]
MQPSRDDTGLEVAKSPFAPYLTGSPTGDSLLTFSGAGGGTSPNDFSSRERSRLLRTSEIELIRSRKGGGDRSERDWLGVRLLTGAAEFGERIRDK